MVNVTSQYRMFVPRRRRIGAGATVDILPPAVNVVSGDYSAIAPDTIEVHYPTPTSEPRIPAFFAFWSVRGSADGEFTQGEPALHAHTSSYPMTATAWYWLGSPGGNGNGPTELETDAFLVDEDSFVEPTPIEDVNPSDAWDHSDVDEFVFTNQEASDVTALESVVDAAEHFERWYALEGGSTPTAGRGLHVPKDDNGIAIATYRIPPPVHFKPPREGGIGGTIVGGVGVDGGGGIIINGIFHPIGPWNPFLAALAVLGASDGLPAQARVRVQLEALRAIGREAQQLQAELRSASERS